MADQWPRRRLQSRNPRGEGRRSLPLLRPCTVSFFHSSAAAASHGSAPLQGAERAGVAAVGRSPRLRRHQRMRERRPSKILDQQRRSQTRQPRRQQPLPRRRRASPGRARRGTSPHGAWRRGTATGRWRTPPGRRATSRPSSRSSRGAGRSWRWLWPARLPRSGWLPWSPAPWPRESRGVGAAAFALPESGPCFRC